CQAERTAAVGDFIARNPDAIHPITRDIIAAGRAYSGIDVFRCQQRLTELRAAAARELRRCDVLMVPTVPRPVTLAEVRADPIGSNAGLATYPNFATLLALAALACPVSLAADGTPHGITLLAPEGRDAELAGLGALFNARTPLPLGALAV